MAEMQSSVEALEAFEKVLGENADAGRWMVALWTIKDGRLRLENRTTWQFPTGDFKGAVRLLDESCLKELSSHDSLTLLPDDPLPSVDLSDFEKALGIAQLKETPSDAE